MSMQSKNLIGFFLFAATLCAVILTGCADSEPKPIPDPLAGFSKDYLYNPDAHKTIIDDYKDYIQQEKLQSRSPIILFYEDGKGQHAVKIMYGIDGTDWEHVLIYDKDNKRIKTIKYSAGHYSC